MSTRDLWNRYARYFNAEEEVVFPQDLPELNFYKSIRKQYSGECLEIGAGSGRLAKSLLREAVTVALEPSEAMLHGWSSLNSPLALRIQGTGERMPFRTGHFPFVCFPYNGLQCVGSEETGAAVLKEAFRVTAPGGVFLLEVSPIFGRREPEPLTERYSAAMPDGSKLILRESIERDTLSGSIQYHMHYSVINGGTETTEKITLELAATSRDQIIALMEETGFCDVTEWGDYDRSRYDDQLSPRLLVLAEKEV